MKKYFGDKEFYRMVLAIAVPMMIQNGFSNFVSFLDNIMVGRIGTEQMSGVAIANQLLLVFFLTIFGAVSGASIFGAQFYGLGDKEGVRHTFRFKIIMCTILAAVVILVFAIKGNSLIALYLTDEDDAKVVADTLQYGSSYLRIMLIGLLPQAIAQAYASTLRDTGETKMPMRAGVAAVIVNMVLNLILIFGLLGAPKLGVVGAAIATVISRFVELSILLYAVHGKNRVTDILEGSYASLRIPGALVKKIAITGFPLLLNETLWSLGMAVMNQCYSIRGIQVIAAINICSTASNLFNVVFMSLGSSIAIIVGQMLGAGETEKAVDTDRKMIAFSVFCCIGIGALLALCSPFIPHLYKTEPQVRSIATRLIMIAGLCMPIHAFNHAAYFTMRSGGKTLITFFFDSVYVWIVNIPLAYALAHFTSMPIEPLYLCCLLIDLIKCTSGYILIRKRAWVKNIVADTQ